MKYLSRIAIILLPLVGYTEQVVPVDKVERQREYSPQCGYDFRCRGEAAPR